MQSTRTDSLERIISAVGELPASPAIVSSVMGLTSNLDSPVVDISKVLSADQSLAAKVLKLSNSPFYGRSKAVKTLEEAILLLGFYEVRSLVMATSAHNMYNQDDTGDMASKLWRHSLSTAVTARQIAAKIKFPNKDELFIAALLHDIGKLVLLQQIPGRYRDIVTHIEQNSLSFYEIENWELNFTHCDVADILLEQWSFPQSLRQAIFDHHSLPPIEEGVRPPMSYVIHLANNLAKELGHGFNDKRLENIEDLESAHLLGLDKETLSEILIVSEEHFNIELRILEAA
jgi:putative nucleotidyltransferase with HDIG domain